MKMKDQNTEAIPLTDENLRLVNLYLLTIIKDFKPNGIQGMYEKLDTSFKEGSFITSEAMRKAIRRDLQYLQKLTNNPKKLHEWFRNQKKGEKLKIRINGDQFLLNNILKIIGIDFEELFNKDNLPGITEVSKWDVEINKGDDDSQQYEKHLQEINEKLDIIIEKYAGDRIRKTYMNRFNDLIEYILLMRDSFLNFFYNPIKNGFSKKIVNEQEKLIKPIEIFGTELFYIQYFMEKLLDKRYQINKIFNELFSYKVENNISNKRMLSSFFLIGIVEQLLINFIRRGNSTGKSIFQLVINEDGFKIEVKMDTNKILDKVVNVNNKTLSFITHVLESELEPDDALCIKCEILFVEYFNNISSLFQIYLPKFSNLQDIISKSLNDKEMQKEINNLFTPGKQFSFGIKSEQLHYFDIFIDKIEEIQIGLDKFYKGNADVFNDSPKTEIGFTPP